MQAGKIIHWERLELGITVHSSYTRSNEVPEIRSIGQLLTRCTPSKVDLFDSICLQTEHFLVGQDSVGETRSVCRLKIRPYFVDLEVPFEGWKEKIFTKIELKDVQLYCTRLAKWKLFCKELCWFVEGKQEYSHSEMELSSDILTPSSIPLLGIPAELSAECSVHPQPFLGFGKEHASYEAEVHCKVEGGWRFFHQGCWEALPVLVETSKDIGASDTFNGYVHARTFAKYKETPLSNFECTIAPDGQESIRPVLLGRIQIDKSFDSVQSKLMLVPNLPKRVCRMNSDYVALIKRGGMPAFYRLIENGSSEHTLDDADPNGLIHKKPRPLVREEVITPKVTSELGVIRSKAHLLEEPFLFHTVAPHFSHHISWEVHDLDLVTLDLGIFPLANGKIHGPVPDYEFKSERWIRQHYSIVSFPNIKKSEIKVDFLSLLEHSEATVMYLNTVGHPHWSYFYYFPNHTDLDEWKLGEEKFKSSDYWMPIRSQFLVHSSLEKESVWSRNHLISAPLLEGSLDSKIESSWMNVPTTWWGIHRFHVKEHQSKKSCCFSEKNRSCWSFKGCQASFGKKISLRPSANQFSLECDLAGFSNPPFCFSFLGGAIEVNWDLKNVKRCQVYLVGSSGDRCLFAESPGRYSRGKGFDSCYAGSWAQNFGFKTLRDCGEDIRGEGRSSSYLKDVFGVCHFDLLRGSGARKLRFEFEVKCLDQDICLDYPLFYSPDEPPKVIHETGQTACLIWPRGAGIRWGQWKCGDGKSIFNKPQLAEIGSMRSVLDWICWRRLIFEGAAMDDSIQREVRCFYDEIECPKEAMAGVNTHSFLISSEKSSLGVLVNSLSEVPPLCCFPVRARNQVFSPVGEWVQESWSYAQEPCYYVVSGDFPLHLLKAGDSRKFITKESLIQIPGWRITEHCYSFGRGKDSICKLLIDGQEIAKASGWHGYFGVYGVPRRKRSYPWNLFSQVGGYHKVRCLEGEVVYDRSFRKVDTGSSFVLTLTRQGDCESARIAESSDGRLWMGYGCSSLGVYACFSDDGGSSWGGSIMSFPGGKFPTISCSVNGMMVHAAFCPVSGEKGKGFIGARVQYLGQKVLSEIFYFKDSMGKDLVVEEDSFHLVQSYDGSGRWILVVNLFGEDSPSDWESLDDCRTWRRFKL